MEKLVRTLFMIKTIENSHGGNIPSQLQKFKGLGSFGNGDNANCLPLQSIESVQQVLCGSIEKVRRVPHTGVNQGLIKKTRVFGREEPTHLVQYAWLLPQQLSTSIHHTIIYAYVESDILYLWCGMFVCILNYHTR